MLTAAQCRTVAFLTDGGVICTDCARSSYGEHTIDRLVEGLDAGLGDELRPLIEYELSEWQGEQAWNSATLHESEDGTFLESDDGLEFFESYGEAEEALYELYGRIYCDDCTEELS